MPSLRASLLFLLVLQTPVFAQSATPPEADISNGVLQAVLYLPNAHDGFYRGTRFDWSGVIRSLTYKGHDYYGPWFTKTDPKVIDFIFKGPEIVAGPCSAITGPVEEFSSHRKALGFDAAKPGGTFVKIGVGALRKPDDRAYNHYRLYEIVDHGKWSIRTERNSVEFTQVLTDPGSGYAYRYTKIVRLIPGRPEMTIEHSLENTGRQTIATSVYDHNFLVLDKQPTGPDFVITLPYTIHATNVQGAELARIEGNHFTYRKRLRAHEVVAADFSGFGKTTADYKIRIENRKDGAGMTIAGNRPLSREGLWSIRSVIAVEPFIDLSIQPGKTFKWEYHYTYYSLNRGK